MRSKIETSNHQQTTTLPIADRSPSAGGGRRVAFTLLTILFGLGAAAAGAAAAASSRSGSPNERVVPGVRIADLDVGGLTVDQATERARAWARTQSAKPLVLHAPESGRTWNVTLADAGVRFDVAEAVGRALAVGQKESVWERLILQQRERDVTVSPSVKLDEAALEKQLQRIARAVNMPAKDAKGKIDATGAILVLAPEQKGVALDIAGTKAAILQGGADHLAAGDAEATLVVQETEPKVTAEKLREVQHPLVALDSGWPSTKNHLFTTYYGSSSSNRRHNIELAASHINGTILAPGEVFSYNGTVGPRDPKLGFRDAPTYQDGQVVPGPGGGVCQVSTTLYNAVLRSPGMKVVQRQHHSMPVHYVPAGCDATVAYNDLDFKFRNDTGGPVLIAAKTQNGDLSFGLYGTQPVAEKKVEVIAGSRRYHPSGSFSVTTLRRTVDAAGAVHVERLGTDTYQPLKETASRKPASRSTRKTTLPSRGAAPARPAAAAARTPAAPAPAAKPAAPAATPAAAPAAASPAAAALPA